MGLGTAATTMPIGGGDRMAGLPLDILVTPLVAAPSVFFTGDSPGKGDCSFCSCCFFWILRCSCCLASTGDGRVFTCGWKELLSAVGIKAEGWGIPFIPENKRRTNYNQTYLSAVVPLRYLTENRWQASPKPCGASIHFMLKSIQLQFISTFVTKSRSVRQAGH